MNVVSLIQFELTKTPFMSHPGWHSHIVFGNIYLISGLISGKYMDVEKRRSLTPHLLGSSIQIKEIQQKFIIRSRSFDTCKLYSHLLCPELLNCIAVFRRFSS